MKIIASIAMAGMIAASTLTGTIAPANAGSFKFSVHNHSGGHYHGGHHKKRRYHHRRHHSDYGGAIVAGTILGLALGAIATPSYHYPPAVYGHHRSQRYSGHYPHAVGPHRNARHVSWCYSRYKSYKANTNTWLGYDGYIHQCVSPY